METVESIIARHGAEEIVVEPYLPGGGFPLFLQPREPSLFQSSSDVRRWLAGVPFKEWLARAGAIVLRGFPIASTDDFIEVTGDFAPLASGYAGGNAPRETIKGSVMESTRAASSALLYLHQEMAYLPQFPDRLAFYCHLPSETGGETIVASIRLLQQRIPRDLFARVEQVGLRYIRNFRSPERPTGDPVLDDFHQTWLKAFKTGDREEINAVCEARGVAYQWQPDDSITMITDLPGVRKHPITGEPIWFNQLHTMAMRPPVASEQMYKAMNDLYDHSDMTRPYSVRFGDDAEIPDRDLDALYEAFNALTVAFSWRKGDVMFLDNYAAAHGRNPYAGARDVQVQLFS
jgi:alpha-ketoglutarate-dependent taurine dioxygenase